jgi:geranylgeranyl pyrophosphate synthase
VIKEADTTALRILCRMDDVEDSSELRRGIPVAHKIYGVPQTINTANYVYFLAMQELYRFRASRKVKDAEQGRKEDDNLDEVITGTFRSRPESLEAISKTMPLS